MGFMILTKSVLKVKRSRWLRIEVLSSYNLSKLLSSRAAVSHYRCTGQFIGCT